MNKKKLSLVLIILIVFLGMTLSGYHFVEAGNTDTATLRIIATGDLHGQITAYNYETNSEMPENGLSKLATIVKQKKSEVGINNALLVDAGDFLYDYSSNYFYDNYPDMTQPIMKAMSAMGYDYITLGNHEFDYPWEYLSRQLKVSGLSDKVLVCNTVWHDSGKQVFNPSAIVTKTLTTANQKTVSVQIGIIGATTNSMSARRGDYVNVIDAVNNYDSIIAEANRLKTSEKVDLVVVILHGGIGTKTINKKSENIGYALTKESSVDAIVTAHTHEIFPNTSNPRTGLSNVNTSTGYINGKPVLATSSHAGALGTIDLTMEVAAGGSVALTSGKASITLATKDGKEDSTITELFRAYLTKLKASADPTTYPITKGITYHNYDTVLQDSNLFQLLNNAKIDYGLTYIAENLPKYKNVPIIACTRNLLDNTEPYLLMQNTLSASKISQILSISSASRPSGYIQMYEISGKALREWLEYNASIYATQGTLFKNLLKTYTSKNKGVSTLLQESYVYNWNSEYVFDGISYTIDLTKKARYYSNGTMISSSNKRISSLTYQGVSVKDTQKFVLVTDSGIPSLSFLPEDIYGSIKEVKDYEIGKNITLNYIKKLSAFGNINITADHNWSLTAGTKYTFLLGIPKKIAGTVSKFSWNNGLAADTTSYSFLKGKLPVASQKISIVVAQGRTEINNQPVPIIISATSKYALKEIKYLQGKIQSSSDKKWNQAQIVKNSTFIADKNGIYTIRVIDTKGNSSLAYVTVDRYDEDILASPKLNRLTNRNSTLTGTAVPNTMLHAAIGNKDYSVKVASDGTFTMNIKPPKAFASISAYAESSGKKSAVVTAAVRKSGPNAVELNAIRIGDTYVTGTADANTFVYALIWKTIYVGKGQTKAYQSSEYYKSDYNIVETNITMDQNTGNYKIELPYLKTNMKVFVFAVDRFGTTSKSTMEVPGY